MNVLMISPGYPGEMPKFTRGLARVGARVIGLGDQPGSALPHEVREVLDAHIHVPDLWNDAAVVDQVRREVGPLRIDRVECLWEPAMILAARLREALGAPGLSVDQTVPFRDKEHMKRVIDGAGLRTPHHYRARSGAECRDAADRIGYPLIVKPIDGAGSRDTYRIDDRDQLERAIAALGHVNEVSVEEFIDGEELTYDTICANGEVLFENIAFYRPRPIEEKKHEWVSPTSICRRDIDAPELADGRAFGRRVLEAMQFRTGFTHLEWYRKPDGEVVFGEIGARPPGSHMVEAMNFVSDVDLFTGWAEAVCHGSFSQPLHRRFHSAIVCKRARGQGRVRAIEGLDRLLRDFGDSVVAVDILPLGAQRRNWQMTSVSDGFLIVRHPDLETTLQMAARIGSELTIHAG